MCFPWILGKSCHRVAGEESVKINGSLKPERGRAGTGRARQGWAEPGRYEAVLAAREPALRCLCQGRFYRGRDVLNVLPPPVTFVFLLSL